MISGIIFVRIVLREVANNELVAATPAMLDITVYASSTIKNFVIVLVEFRLALLVDWQRHRIQVNFPPSSPSP